MKPAQIQILRDGIVSICQAAGSAGMTLPGIRANLRPLGFGKLTDDELDPHLHFLTSDEKLTVSGAEMHAAVKRWTITAAGTRYAEAHGLD